MAQLDARLTGYQEVAGSTPAQHLWRLIMKYLIQEGHLSVSGERMGTILVNHLED